MVDIAPARGLASWIVSTVAAIPVAERRRATVLAVAGATIFIGIAKLAKGYRFYFKSQWPDEEHAGSIIPVYPGSRWKQSVDSCKSPADATQYHDNVMEFARAKKAKVVKVLSLFGDMYWLTDMKDNIHMLDQCPNKAGQYQNFRKTFFGWENMFTMLRLDDQRRSRQRKVMAYCFSNLTLKGYTADFDKCLADLFKVFDDHADKGEELELGDTMVRFTTDVIGRIMFGDSSMDALLGNDTTKGNQMIADVQTLLMNRTRKIQFKPWLYYFGYFDEGQRNAERAQNRLRETYKVMISNYRRGKKHGDFKNDMTVMGRIMTLFDNDEINEDEIVGMMNVFFTAGIDTTAYSMSFCLYDIGANPRIQTKLAQDIQQNGLSSQYCKHVLRESMRWKPVSTMTGFRAVERDLTLPSGVTIRKGATAAAFSYAAFRDVQLDQPDTFIPERWEQGNADQKLVELMQPFSNGPRACIGMQLARLEMDHVIPRIVKSFELTAMEGGNDYLYFTRKPHGRKLKLSRRQSSTNGA